MERGVAPRGVSGQRLSVTSFLVALLGSKEWQSGSHLQCRQPSRLTTVVAQRVILSHSHRPAEKPVSVADQSRAVGSARYATNAREREQ